MQPRFTITNPTAAALSQIERARGFLDAATLSEAWVQRMSSRALLLEAHHTTHIEGTQLTIDQSAHLWAGESIPGTAPDDVQELLNYREAFDLVSEYLTSGEPITEGLIREIHRRLVIAVRGGEAAPGSYRTTQNFVANSVTKEIIYTPPPAYDVAPLMRELVEWINDPGDVHPVLVAGIAQFQLVHIHPFSEAYAERRRSGAVAPTSGIDGNGRTSRLLSTLCLYRTGYDFRQLFTLSEFYDRDRDSFYAALQQVRTDMDLTGWLEFFTRGLSTQLAEVRTRGEIAIRSDVVARQYDLNSRQEAILDAVAADTNLGIAEISSRLGDPHRRTLQRDLRKLVTLGLIQELGSSPTDPTRRYALSTESSFDKL